MVSKEQRLWTQGQQVFPRVSNMNVTPPWDNRREMISLHSHWPTLDVNYWDIKMSLLSIIQEMSCCPLRALRLMSLKDHAHQKIESNSAIVKGISILNTQQLKMVLKFRMRGILSTNWQRDCESKTLEEI